MRILVDADACPVKREIVEVAKEFTADVIMFIDTSHEINDGYSQVVTVDKGRDSVDIALANRVCKNDIVVTQDYGVATMALAKGAFPINQNGMVYNENNIDRLLFERHLSQELRRSGKRGSKTKKRSKEDNDKFRNAIRELAKETATYE